jgi:hypothetical protein
MKKIILFTCIISFSAVLWGQLAQVPTAFLNESVKGGSSIIYNTSNSSDDNILILPHSKAIVQEEIGQTLYDLQTYCSADHRVVAFADGTIGSTFLLSCISNINDIDVAYQYYDGTSWMLYQPTPATINIIKNSATYCKLGANGEAFITREANSLVLYRRTTKGSGSWVTSNLPQTGINPGWARMCTSGNIIHILATDTINYLGQKNPLVYYRSQDGGNTWDIQHQLFNELSPAQGYNIGFDPDVYDWAEPEDNTIAFVVGSKATDLVLMKSTDAGTTWTKTIIFQHPNPNFISLSTDSPYVCDGAHAIALNSNGNANIVFG